MSIKDDIENKVINKNKRMEPYLCSTCLSILEQERGQHCTPCYCGNSEKAQEFKRKLENESQFVEREE